jgi:hypothetical protein
MTQQTTAFLTKALKVGAADEVRAGDQSQDREGAVASRVWWKLQEAIFRSLSTLTTR